MEQSVTTLKASKQLKIVKYLGSPNGCVVLCFALIVNWVFLEILDNQSSNAKTKSMASFLNTPVAVFLLWSTFTMEEIEIVVAENTFLKFERNKRIFWEFLGCQDSGSKNTNRPFSSQKVLCNQRNWTPRLVEKIKQIVLVKYDFEWTKAAERFHLEVSDCEVSDAREKTNFSWMLVYMSSIFHQILGGWNWARRGSEFKVWILFEISMNCSFWKITHLLLASEQKIVILIAPEKRNVFDWGFDWRSHTSHWEIRVWLSRQSDITNNVLTFLNIAIKVEWSKIFFYQPNHPPQTWNVLLGTWWKKTRLSSFRNTPLNIDQISIQMALFEIFLNIKILLQAAKPITIQ